MHRSALLQCLAIAVAGLAFPACQQDLDTQIELVAEQPAAVGNDSANALFEDRKFGTDDDGDDVILGEKKCLMPGPFMPYFNNEEGLIFKSTPNPNPPYYDPTVCASAPFSPALGSGGRMTAVQYRVADGQMGFPEMVEIGYGTLCIKIQDTTFTPFGPPILAYGQITVSNISITVNGTCTITNSATPVAGVSQMACALPLIAPLPEGYSGGLLTTNSVLNLAGVQGISGGSILGLHLYRATPLPPVAPVAPIMPSISRAMELDAQSLLPGASIW